MNNSWEEHSHTISITDHAIPSLLILRNVICTSTPLSALLTVSLWPQPILRFLSSIFHFVYFRFNGSDVRWPPRTECRWLNNRNYSNSTGYRSPLLLSTLYLSTQSLECSWSTLRYSSIIHTCVPPVVKVWNGVRTEVANSLGNFSWNLGML